MSYRCRGCATKRVRERAAFCAACRDSGRKAQVEAVDAGMKPAADPIDVLQEFMVTVSTEREETRKRMQVADSQERIKLSQHLLELSKQAIRVANEIAKFKQTGIDKAFGMSAEEIIVVVESWAVHQEPAVVKKLLLAVKRSHREVAFNADD